MDWMLLVTMDQLMLPHNAGSIDVTTTTTLAGEGNNIILYVVVFLCIVMVTFLLYSKYKKKGLKHVEGNECSDEQEIPVDF